MKQKIFPRHFCPVLRIKFFNPEYIFRFLCALLVQIRNIWVRATTTKLRSECTGNKIKTVVLWLSPALWKMGKARNFLLNEFFKWKMLKWDERGGCESGKLTTHLNCIMVKIVIYRRMKMKQTWMALEKFSFWKSIKIVISFDNYQLEEFVEIWRLVALLRVFNAT